ncbi:MAG: porin [Gammaproteobacteria bacterium]|nr:porin [Gammaproteobacteria bacterium]
MKPTRTAIALLAGLLVAMPATAATDVSTKGGLSAENGDEFSFKFGGRIQLDYAIFDEDNVPMSNGYEFRRARLFASGTLYQNWDYKAQYDFAGDDLTAKDLYVRYSGLDNASVTIGQFKQPFGLEELTSSKYITFMERSGNAIFATSRRIGVGYNSASNDSTFAASFYGQPVGFEPAGDEGLGLGARYTTLLSKSDDGLFHLGAAVAIEEAADSDLEELRFRARPSAHLAERLVDTGTFAGVDTLTKLGVEAAWVSGPLSVQGEFMTADVARADGFEDAAFSGYYAFVSYFLDGVTSRPYKKGSFGRVKASGVWELGLRLSVVDLNDEDAGFAGGELTDITIGANYYVNPNLRFMFNYVMAEGEYIGGATEEPNAIQVRMSFDF